MSKENLRKILESMEGMTYSEWKKLEHVINTKFSAEATKIANNVVMPSADSIVESFEQLF